MKISVTRILLPLSLVFCVHFAIAAPADKGRGQADGKTMKGNVTAAEREHAQARREMAEDRREMAEDRREMAEDRREMADQKQDGAASPNERATAMKARQDERQRIKEEYRDSDEKVKGKKPWWKFWE